VIFFVIWGTRRRTENWGPVAPARCRGCHRDVFFQHVMVESTSHIFFIPLRTDTRHVLVCPVCGFQLDLTGELVKAASTMSADHARWRGGIVTDEHHANAVGHFWDSMRGIEDDRVPRASDGAIALGLETRDDVAEGWYPDPTGRHDCRFFDGSWWTAYVLDGGETSSDTFLTPTGAGWYPDAHLRHELRYWDGKRWTDQTQDAGVEVLDPV
jgi:hypothetical protein